MAGTGTFRKGDPRINRGGRPKGSKNKRTEEWEKLANYITKRGARRLVKALENMPDDKFIEQYAKILSYFKPQLKQVDANIEGGNRAILIGFTNDDDNSDSEPDE